MRNEPGIGDQGVTFAPLESHSKYNSIFSGIEYAWKYAAKFVICPRFLGKIVAQGLFFGKNTVLCGKDTTQVAYMGEFGQPLPARDRFIKFFSGHARVATA